MMRSTKTGNRLVAVIRHPRGMTLFELLGVLIVLGIVAAIAIPAISGVISQSEIIADTRTRERVANQAEIYMNAIDIDGDCKIDEHGNMYAVTVEADVVCTPATTAPVSPATVTIGTAYLVKKGFLKEVPVLQANNKMYTSVKVAYVLRSGTDAGSWKVVAPTTDIGPIVPPVSPAETAMTVTQLSLGGLRAPVAGETAVTQVTLTSDYASGQVSWSPTLDGGKFNADTVYTATVTMIPVRGKTVYGVETDAYTLSEATATHVSHVAHSGVIVAVFAKTDAPVTQRTLGGIVVPVTGAQAVTQVTETTQYTGSVSWSPALDDGKFASHTGYVATVTLHPKKGIR